MAPLRSLPHYRSSRKDKTRNAWRSTLEAALIGRTGLRSLTYSKWSIPMETYDALLASITPDTGETRTIFDPATGTAVGEAPVHTVADLEEAIAAAAAAQPAWAALGHEARSAALLKAADAVERSAEELARLLSREQGKPLNGPNARFEVGGRKGVDEPRGSRLDLCPSKNFHGPLLGRWASCR